MKTSLSLFFLPFSKKGFAEELSFSLSAEFNGRRYSEGLFHLFSSLDSIFLGTLLCRPTFFWEELSFLIGLKPWHTLQWNRATTEEYTKWSQLWRLRSKLLWRRETGKVEYDSPQNERVSVQTSEGADRGMISYSNDRRRWRTGFHIICLLLFLILFTCCLSNRS